MRFQVLGSTVQYSHPILSATGRVTLRYSVFPCGRGELKFSDGNRLVARDLSEKWGRPLTIGDLFGEAPSYDDVLNDGGKWPLDAEVMISTEKCSEISFLKSEDSACGYANYCSDESSKGLFIWLSVNETAFADLLQVRSDLPEKMYFDIDIPGLKDLPYVNDENWLQGSWDLDDKSDCGDGNFRVVTGFSLERHSSFFPAARYYDVRQMERTEDRQAIEKLRSAISNLVAMKDGSVDGVEARLMRLNLFAVTALVGIGTMALIPLYF